MAHSSAHRILRLLRLCRLFIPAVDSDSLLKLPLAILPFSTSRPSSASLSPLFVTWNKYRSVRSRGAEKDDDEEPHLRGCIGTFQAGPLGEGLRDYAITRYVLSSSYSLCPGELPLSILLTS